MNGARTELGVLHILHTPGMPTVSSSARSYLDCGCAAYVGVYVSSRGHAIVVVPCDPEHRDIAERFNVLLAQDPDRRQLTIQRAAELLSIAESLT